MGDKPKQNSLITNTFDEIRTNIQLIREDAKLMNKDNLSREADGLEKLIDDYQAELAPTFYIARFDTRLQKIENVAKEAGISNPRINATRISIAMSKVFAL